MINAVYQLVKPGMIDVTYKEFALEGDKAVVRPLRLSICKADSRYYGGKRSHEAIRRKLPMALIHECVAEVVYDPSGAFRPGARVVPVPNAPTHSDDVVAENYLESSRFASSSADGFLQDYIFIEPVRLVPMPEDIDLNVAAFTELVSVAVHAVARFEKFSHARRDDLGVWGDGNLGYITALMLKYVFPYASLRVFGAVEEKLSYFTFAAGAYHVDADIGGMRVDHAFECVGGSDSAAAVNQIIGLVKPEGTVALLGVSETDVPLNTRLILEKGLRVFGSSRSGKADFVSAVELMRQYPEIPRYLVNLVGDVVEVRSIRDIHRAFELESKRSFGKTVLVWNK